MSIGQNISLVMYIDEIGSFLNECSSNQPFPYLSEAKAWAAAHVLSMSSDIWRECSHIVTIAIDS